MCSIASTSVNKYGPVCMCVYDFHSRRALFLQMKRELIAQLERGRHLIARHPAQSACWCTPPPRWRPRTSASDNTVVSVTQINHAVATAAAEEGPFGTESLNERAQLAGESTELSATEITRDQSISDTSSHACAKILRECCDLPDVTTP